MERFVTLIVDYPTWTFRIMIVLSVLVVLALLAIIRLPSAIKRLTRTLIRLQTGEKVSSIDAFLWKNENECNEWRKPWAEKWVDKKYFDEQAWLEREKQMKQFEHSDKPVKQRWNERVKRNRQYRNEQDVDEKPVKKKVVKKAEKKVVKKVAKK